MAAPWVLGYPRAAGGWGNEVLTDFWTGAAVVMVSALGFLGYGSSIRRALRPTTAQAAHVSPPEAPPAPAPQRDSAPEAPAPSPQLTPARSPVQVQPGADLDDILVPIATALLSDLAKRGSDSDGAGGSSASAEGGAS
jgi:hypothetical protein